MAIDKLQVIMGTLPGNTKQTSADSDSESQSFTELQSSCPTLSHTQRMTGFAICFVSGYIISFAATLALISGVGSMAIFGLLYSIGNIIALCGTGFLIGPIAQIKSMFHPTRRIATIVYLSLILIVLIVALAIPRSGPFVLILVIIQCFAATWYAASYIPFARKFITSSCSRMHAIV